VTNPRQTQLPGYRVPVLRWLYTLMVGGILSGFTFLLLTGEYVNDGPVVIAVTESHGLHAGDLFVMAGWAVGMAALALLAMNHRVFRAP
jgi:hypothetical protein